MAFGVTLAVMVGIKLFREPPAPLAMTEPVPQLVEPAPREAVPDPELEAPAEPVVEEPVVEDPPAEQAPAEAQPGREPRPAEGGTAPRGAGEGSTPRTPQAPRVDPEAAARLAQFQDDGAEAAPIPVAPRNNPLAEDRDRGGGELNAEQVRTVINRERTAVQRCYETAARMTGTAPRLRIDVDVTIGGSGTVTSATARGQSFGSITECIERSVRRWRFPATGGTTRTSMPFVFQGREQ
jgi:hypothetical protein